MNARTIYEVVDESEVVTLTDTAAMHECFLWYHAVNSDGEAFLVESRNPPTTAELDEAAADVAAMLCPCCTLIDDTITECVCVEGCPNS